MNRLLVMKAVMYLRKNSRIPTMRVNLGKEEDRVKNRTAVLVFPFLAARVAFTPFCSAMAAKRVAAACILWLFLQATTAKVNFLLFANIAILLLC